MIHNLVVFLGNPLAGDDASGFYLFQAFDEPKNTRKLFLGTDLFRLYSEYNGEERLILVDAVSGINNVVHVYNERLLNIAGRSEHAHFLSAIEILKILKIVMDSFPKDIHLIGIPAKDFTQKTVSSALLEKALQLLNRIIGKT